MKIAVVGTGMIAREALTALRQVEGVEVVAICARPQSRDKARALAQEFGIAQVADGFGGSGGAEGDFGDGDAAFPQGGAKRDGIGSVIQRDDGDDFDGAQAFGQGSDVHVGSLGLWVCLGCAHGKGLSFSASMLMFFRTARFLSRLRWLTPTPSP